MRLEDLAESLEKQLGVNRRTVYMAYEEAFYLGAPGFSIHLCSKHNVMLVVRMKGPENLVLSEVGVEPKNTDIPLDVASYRRIHASKSGKHMAAYIDVKGVEEAASIVRRLLGSLELRECGYEVLTSEG